MKEAILLTSFTTWKPEQPSNSSDDLMDEVIARYPYRDALHIRRKLPVDFQLASRRAIAAIRAVRPGAVVCCGMGERRTSLDVESRAVNGDRILYTPVNLEALTAGLAMTGISHDAGRFVCNQLYYDVLNHLQLNGPGHPCIFVHVPVLTPDNRGAIAADFLMLLDRVRSLIQHPANAVA
ncbi:MAG: peptidase C15 [Synechococcales bacterium]|nr:peptidase C15 [Synechococcales bacterium]